MLCMGLVLAQQEGGINKRLRFRRPKPQLTDIANPEGDEAGPPIPLRRIPAGTFKLFQLEVATYIINHPDTSLMHRVIR